MSKLAYAPPIPAPEFSSMDSQAFHAHVSALKRAPQRKSASKPRTIRLAALKLAENRPGKVLELQSGFTIYVLPYRTERSGRRLNKFVESSDLASASKMLLRDLDSLRAFLEKKKYIILGAPT